jgi:membrane protease YdiL (CAAX protease family)
MRERKMPKTFDDYQYHDLNLSAEDREQDIKRAKDESGSSTQQRNESMIPWVFLLGLAAAELAVGYWSIGFGMALHVTLLIASLIMAVISWYRWEINRTAGGSARREAGQPVQLEEELQDQSQVGGKAAFYGYRFYIGLALAPLIRILSLSIPLKGVAPQYFYLIPGIPLLAAIFVAAKMAGFRRSDIYLTLGSLQNTWKNWKVQLAIALLGFPLGFMEYSILHPEPIVSQLTPGAVMTASIILIIFTGLTEELTFRGIMKRATDDFLGERISVIYVSLVFSVLHITHLSALDVLFVFGVALLFSSIVHQTKSLYGVTLAHGLTNINLFIIGPYLLG